MAASTGVANKVSRTYTAALSGFAVKDPTPQELQALRSDPSVLSVTLSTRMYASTYSSPWFLSLTGKDGEEVDFYLNKKQRHACKHNKHNKSEPTIKGLWDKVSW